MSGIEILKAPQYKPSLNLRTLSPITIYSTFTKPDGSKLTHYYAPYEKDWNKLILANLAKKAKAEWLRYCKTCADAEFCWSGDLES